MFYHLANFFQKITLLIYIGEFKEKIMRVIKFIEEIIIKVNEYDKKYRTV